MNAPCQVHTCRTATSALVVIALPGDWTATETYSSLEVRIAACKVHARELERRQRAIQEARGDLHNLLAVVERACEAEVLTGVARDDAQPEWLSEAVNSGDGIYRP